MKDMPKTQALLGSEKRRASSDGLMPVEAANLPAATREEVALECADVLLFLLRLADKLDIDLAAAAKKKLALNAKKYPVAKSRGRATKYDRL